MNKRTHEKRHLLSTWRRLKRNRLSVAGLTIVVAVTLVAMFAPYLPLKSPLKQDLRATCEGVSAKHWFGTDQIGRDVLSRVVFGARITLGIATLAVILGALFGTAVGMIGGYYGRRMDALVGYLVDILLAFPELLLAIAVVAATGPGIIGVILASGFSTIPQFIRITRGIVLAEKEKEYILAARSIGEKNVSIMCRYILPNCVPPLIVFLTLRMAVIILIAAGLSFLGLGAQPPLPEWGAMLNEGRGYLVTAPHISIFPGLAIMTLVLAFNLFGDGLRDALDPRMKI
jgi:peptide/nickel transport system permease protein